MSSSQTHKSLPFHDLIDCTACRMPHFVYSEAEVNSVVPTEHGVNGAKDKIAFSVMRLLRTTFDAATGYGTSAHLTKSKYLNVSVAPCNTALLDRRRCHTTSRAAV